MLRWPVYLVWGCAAAAANFLPSLPSFPPFPPSLYYHFLLAFALPADQIAQQAANHQRWQLLPLALSRTRQLFNLIYLHLNVLKNLKNNKHGLKRN